MDDKYMYGAGETPEEMKERGVSWKEIEKAVATKFSKKSRKEIYECTRQYSHELSRLEAGAPPKDVDALRNNLLKHTKALCEIADKFRPMNGDEAQDEDRKVMDTLTYLHSYKDFFLREELHLIASHAHKLVVCLSREPRPLEVTSRNSKLSALQAFIAEALLDAETKPARREPSKNKDEYKKHKEFKRWNVPIGPRVPKFQVFVNVVLKEEFSSDQVSNAFNAARKAGAKSLEEVFDHANLRGKNYRKV